MPRNRGRCCRGIKGAWAGKGAKRLPDFRDELLNVPRVLEDSLQPLGDDRLVADVALEDAGRVVEDFVDGAGHFTEDAIGAGAGRRHFFDGQQLERVDGNGHLAGEQLEELQVVLAEGARLGALDVEGAENFVVENQGHGE